MSTRSYLRSVRTVEVAVYPDGHRVTIAKDSLLGWQWDQAQWSSHKEAAKRQAREAGAEVVRESNHHYRVAHKLPRFDALITQALQGKR